MRSQKTDSDIIRAAVRAFNRAVLKMAIYGIVQRDHALRDQGQKRGGRERFCDGRQAECCPGRRLQPSLAIGPFEAFVPNDASAVGHRNRYSSGRAMFNCLKDLLPDWLEIVLLRPAWLGTAASVCGYFAAVKTAPNDADSIVLKTSRRVTTKFIYVLF